MRKAVLKHGMGGIQKVQTQGFHDRHVFMKISKHMNLGTAKPSHPRQKDEEGRDRREDDGVSFKHSLPMHF